MTGRSARYGWYVLGLLAAANLLHYANRNVMFHVAIYDDLRPMLRLSNADMGFLGTMAFMVPHALASLPVGWFADRFDRRRVMALGILLWSAGSLLFAISTGFVSMVASRALVGLGCAACVPVANAIICDVFPGDHTASRVSIFNLGLFVGGAVGIGVGGALGFPLAFLVVGAPGVIIAYLISRLDLPPPVAAPSSSMSWRRTLSWRTFFTDAASAFRIRTLRWMFVGAILMAFAAGGYIGWFIAFLSAKGMTESDAMLLFSCAFVAGLAGVLCGGQIADRLYRRHPAGRQRAAAIGFTAAVPCALAAIWLPRSAPFYLASCGLMFFSMWYHGPIAAAVDDLAPEENAATNQGVYILLMHLIGTAPSSWAVGWMVDRVGIDNAMLLPTGAMALAAIAFAISTTGVAADLVVKRSGG